MLGAIAYIVLFSLLIFSIRKDEGREEIPKIIRFVNIFLIFKVVFVLSMLLFLKVTAERMLKIKIIKSK